LSNYQYRNEEEEEVANSDTPKVTLNKPDGDIKGFLKIHPLIIANYACKLMIMCGYCYENLQALNIDGFDNLISPLRDLFARIQSRFIDIICKGLTVCIFYFLI
jgi:hypothetical protein